MRLVFESADILPDSPHRWTVVCWQKFDDGRPDYKFTLLFPLDTLEWRAAEYDIDPTDVHTLWDMVVAELLMTPEDYAGEPTLYQHDDLEAVKAAHLARVARVKWRHRISTRDSHPAHAAVKKQSPMHPEALALKRLHRDKNHSQQCDVRIYGNVHLTDEYRITNLRRGVKDV